MFRTREVWMEIEKRLGNKHKETPVVEMTDADEFKVDLKLDKNILEGLWWMFSEHRDYFLQLCKELSPSLPSSFLSSLLEEKDFVK
jgi:hypothetical protein